MTKLRCLNCDQIIESKSVHDFVECDCEDEKLRHFLDGGDEYIRVGGDPNYEILPEEKERKEKG